ncbi:MAG TPA: phosphatase PAP2 family protein [Acidimicrobiales bacterium]|nr:phosphatase PAP2 family protein [Acidimicrobiales bacterium]
MRDNSRERTPRGGTILDPRPDGVAQRWGESLGHRNAFIAYVVVLIGAIVALSVVLVGLGFLVTHVIERGSLGTWDHHVSDWFSVHGRSPWNGLTGDVTLAADTFEVAGVAVLLTLVLLFRKWGRRSFLLATSLAIELSVFLIANTIVKRPRPHVRHIGGTPSTYSFPSGHTAATIALYAGIAVIVCAATTKRGLRILAWTIAVLLMISVGVSRVYRGDHYVTDVVAGAILGIASLWSAVFIIRLVQADQTTRRTAPAAQVAELASSTARGGP